MVFTFLKVIINEYDRPFEHSFSFRITRKGVGFIIDTPSYSTGIRLSPFSVIGDYIRFSCRQDEKEFHSKRDSVIDECISTVKTCELIAPDIRRVRLYEVIGSLVELKSNRQVIEDNHNDTTT